MNRRDFLLGGGIFGVAGAAIAATKQASQPEGSVTICKDSHIPHPGYLEQAGLAMGHGGKNPEKVCRALIPCQKCGVLFALTPPKKT